MSDSVIARLDNDVMKMVEEAAGENRAKHGDPELCDTKENIMPKKLVDMKVNEYLDILKSDAPAPGGGSVSALAGAEAAGLLLMVCDLTLGKEKFKDFQAVCEEAKTELGPVFDELKAGIDLDTEAFDLVSAAFKMPKSTDEEKKARSEAIQAGTIKATEVPLHNMELALSAIETADKMLGRYNPNCGSDFGVAVLNLRACVLGCYMNVRINIPGIKDEEKKNSYKEKADKIVLDSSALAERLYEETIKTL